MGGWVVPVAIMDYVAEGVFQVTADELWPLVSDTARVNRAIGLQRVHFVFTPRTEGGSHTIGEYRWLGLVVARWTEHPFEFIEGRRLTIQRDYSLGPLRAAQTGIELEAVADGTHVSVFGHFTPRNILGRVLARWIGKQATQRALDECRGFEDYLLGKAPNPFPQLVPGKVNGTRLAQITQLLRSQGTPPAVVDRLTTHLRSEPDEQVIGMRPLELADHWGVDRHETLVGFLRATTLGLLEMRWEVLCPNCRIPKGDFGSLGDLRTQAHCETCNIVFDANIDRLVEVRFNVAPAVREANVGLYCSDGPQATPHIVAQVELEPGQSTDLVVPLRASAFRVRSQQCPGSVLIETDASGATQTSLDLTPDGIAPAALLLSSGIVTIRLENRLSVPAVVVLERQFWPDTAATAALVSTLQEFRDLFSSQVLAPGLQLGVERLALMFTDLAGSTALYELFGQAGAFRVVQDHFRLLEAAVRAEQGAVVKSIGDAIMAVFPTTAGALRAAIAAQAAMHQLELPAHVDPNRLLKVGIHSGACVVVNLNDRLDYFGTTVNTAARTEGQARGGDIMLTVDAARDPGVDEVLATVPLAMERRDVTLRGLSQPMGILRLSPPD